LGENYDRFKDMAKSASEYERNPEMARQYFEWLKKVFDALVAKGYTSQDLNR